MKRIIWVNATCFNMRQMVDKVPDTYILTVMCRRN